jgi:hypothetical protein
MNYKAIPKQNGTNLRKTANGIVAGTAGMADILEGDNYVKDTTQRDWLEVLMMNGKQLAAPVFVATWVCTMTVNPTPVVYPDFVYDASTTSDQPITVYCDDVLVGTYPPNSTIRVVSKNPTLKLA